MIDCPSPNFDERQSPVNMVVLHYTGMADAASAIARLTDPEAKVSTHYLIAEDGQVVRMVDERLRAWHDMVASVPHVARNRVNHLDAVKPRCVSRRW